MFDLYLNLPAVSASEPASLFEARRREAIGLLGAARSSGEHPGDHQTRLLSEGSSVFLCVLGADHRKLAGPADTFAQFAGSSLGSSLPRIFPEKKHSGKLPK